jgi:hypothetical protein
MIIGALLVAIGGFAVYTYQQETKPKGVELNLNENGVTLQKN